ncbi:hypothetical protein PGTUg99_010831 [Puccinia graminis f. sp. tritici]|uniref:Uncharacterized protein n=1 Tax=Puccinia graminis f. sp. tritici TaxID=56615 RepID=A0A5B0Q3F0_PUCGR|nr:hypothetical protein PGTUg99_010831 [Puccinia graminis f. sp. tritici]
MIAYKIIGCFLFSRPGGGCSFLRLGQQSRIQAKHHKTEGTSTCKFDRVAAPFCGDAWSTMPG